MTKIVYVWSKIREIPNVEQSKNMMFEKKDCEWIVHSANAETWTKEQLQFALSKLDELQDATLREKQS